MSREHWLVASLTLALGCARGDEGPPLDSVLPSAGGAGSLGGAPGSGGGAPGAGGAAVGQGGTTSADGGMTATSSSDASSSSSSGMGGAGGGPLESLAHVLMLNGGGSALVGSVYQASNGSGWSTPWTTATIDPVAIEVLGGSVAFGLFRGAADGSLGYVFWSGGQQWSPLVSIAPNVTTAGPPRSSNDGSDIHIVYTTNDGSYGYSLLSGGVFAASESVGTPASVGSAPPAIAALASGTLVTFVGLDGDLHDRVRQNGIWSAEQAHGLTDEAAAVAPALAVPESGPEALVVFNRSLDGALAYATRSGGAWSEPLTIASAFSADPPGLTVLASGEILLAFRGLDQLGYVAAYENGAFGAPEPIASPNPLLICPPSIAKGANGAEAELLYLDQIGVAYWSRRHNGVFSPGVLSGTAWSPSCTAIAAAP